MTAGRIAAAREHKNDECRRRVEGGDHGVGQTMAASEILAVAEDRTQGGRHPIEASDVAPDEIAVDAEPLETPVQVPRGFDIGMGVGYGIHTSESAPTLRWYCSGLKNSLFGLYVPLLVLAAEAALHDNGPQAWCLSRSNQVAKIWFLQRNHRFEPCRGRPPTRP